MKDLLEFIDDLEELQRLAGSSCSPSFSSTLDNMLQDYKERAWLAEEQQIGKEKVDISTE